MTRKAKNLKGSALHGVSLFNDRARLVADQRVEADRLSAKMGIGLPHARRSVLEQSSIDDLIATIELKKEAWADGWGEAELVQGPTLVSHGDERLQAERLASDRREVLSIPRRPVWQDGMSTDELADLETASFMDWRREIALTAQEQGLFLTPYERNLDFWRQLWRCLERSDLLVQIVDARDPDFYYCRDLVRYVNEIGRGQKRLMLLCNKADFLSDEQRARWREYFESKGIDALFFSALQEVRRQQKENVAQPKSRAGADEAKGDVGDEVSPREQRRAGASVFTQAAARDAEEDEGVAASTGMPQGPAARAKKVDPVTVPIPDSDSDENLGGAAEEEEELVVGPEVDEELAGVSDASTLLDELLQRLPTRRDGADFDCGSSTTAAAARRGTIGFVGYPNVGKSTVINALVGSIRVAMSRTPGKTKHIQTLELPAFGVTLCDCPGLVFPSVVATKAHLVINNTVHIDDLATVFAPIALIVQKIGMKQILAKYDCAAFVADARHRSGDHVLDDCHSFCAALAVSRHHFLRVGVPDENWAARKVLKEYVSGALLHVEEPPTAAGAVAAAAAAAAAMPEAAHQGAADTAQEADEGSGSDAEGDGFDDVSAFVTDARGGAGRPERTMTKRRMRALEKRSLKGGAHTTPVDSADCVGVIMAAMTGVNGTNRTSARRGKA